MPNNTPLRACDIDLKTLSVENLHIVFNIKDKKRVEEFLQNAELQKFLTDPYDGDDACRGCRLVITRDEIANTLTIGRKFGDNTFKQIAYKDLVASILNYIMPYTCDAIADIGDFALGDMKLVQGVVDQKDIGNYFKTWERGKPFKIDHAAEQARIEEIIRNETLKGEIRELGGMQALLPMFESRILGMIGDYAALTDKETVYATTDTSLPSDEVSKEKVKP